MKSVLLTPLGPNGNRRYRTAVFDFRTDSRVEAAEHLAKRNTVLLFDGIFLFRPELRDFWEFKVFVEVGWDILVERAVIRDVAYLGSPEAVQEMYAERYIPGQRIYLSECHLKELADVIVHNYDPANPTIEWHRGIGNQGAADNGMKPTR